MMSLYTFSKIDSLPILPRPAGLRIEKSTDITLLSQMGEVEEAEVLRRMASDNDAFIAFIYNQPAAFGWVAKRNVHIGELNHQFALPKGNAYLWNFRTMPAFRGLGIYPILLQHIVSLEMTGNHRLWIIHAPENKASLKGIHKAGFRYTGKLYANLSSGTAFEAVAVSEEEKHLIEEMRFKISNETAASCWNCSSPYLKKRQDSCCCSASQNACTGTFQGKA